MENSQYEARLKQYQEYLEKHINARGENDIGPNARAWLQAVKFEFYRLFPELRPPRTKESPLIKSVGFGSIGGVDSEPGRIKE